MRYLLCRSAAVVAAWSAAFAVAPSFARAGDTVVIESRGEAQGTGDAARTRAIDEAFADAVGDVLSDLLSEESRRRHRKVLYAEVVRRARRYVTSFKVRDERRTEGLVRVEISATVDRDLLRAALAELGIEKQAGGQVDRPPVVLLLKQSAAGDTEVTFGSVATDGGAGGRAFAAGLKGEGFQTVEARGRAPISAEGDPGLPLGDEAAAELAREAGAGGAFVVGILVEEDGAIRGTDLVGARGQALVRVIDAEERGKVIAERTLAAAGFGATPQEAADMAARDLGERAMRAVADAVARYWPAAPPIDDQLVIKIKGARSWAPIAGIVRKLAANDSVNAVHPRSVRKGKVLLGVDTRLTANQILSAVRGARLSNGSVKATARGGEVWVKVEGESRYTFEDE